MRNFTNILRESVSDEYPQIIEIEWDRYTSYQRKNSTEYGWYTYNYMKDRMKPSRKGVETRFLNRLSKAICSCGLDPVNVLPELSKRIMV